MSDDERRDTTHGTTLDDEMEQESRGLVHDHGDPPQAAPLRDAAPSPNDPDDEVERAFWKEMTDDEGNEDE
ncbi:hypothetical protein [Microbacterium sp. G2-8]|uniref:hypothetical protein n=1 Tax=Microbacterium sp. G2-8 TaxID=2842454 RepID=UPI001C899F7A|nr:hypothetical protein [Microbacterium sp. G2-8]